MNNTCHRAKLADIELFWLHVGGWFHDCVVHELYRETPLIMDIHDSIMDIHNLLMDIRNVILNIHNGIQVYHDHPQIWWHFGHGLTIFPLSVHFLLIRID